MRLGFVELPKFIVIQSDTKVPRGFRPSGLCPSPRSSVNNFDFPNNPNPGA